LKYLYLLGFMSLFLTLCVYCQFASDPPGTSWRWKVKPDLIPSFSSILCFLLFCVSFYFVFPFILCFLLFCVSFSLKSARQRKGSGRNYFLGSPLQGRSPLQFPTVRYGSPERQQPTLDRFFKIFPH
jgi:hypothetical protein